MIPAIPGQIEWLPVAIKVEAHSEAPVVIDTFEKEPKSSSVRLTRLRLA